MLRQLFLKVFTEEVNAYILVMSHFCSFYVIQLSVLSGLVLV